MPAEVRLLGVPLRRRVVWVSLSVSVPPRWTQEGKTMRKMLMAALLLTGATYGLANELVGRIVRVSDGDTVTVLDAAKGQHKIRLLDIDAPESSQAYGQKSKDLLASLIAGKDVRVVYSETDQYGRVLGTIFLGDEDVNLKMVEAGLAWRYHYSKNPRYGAAEQAARVARRGLWADRNPVDPWAFRKLKKGSADAPAPAASVVVSGRREYRAGGGPVSGRTPAPVNEDWPETGYWMSTNSGVRHNSHCENYRRTRGYPCRKSEGRPCGKCGG